MTEFAVRITSIRHAPCETYTSGSVSIEPVGFEKSNLFFKEDLSICCTGRSSF
jgi:hypothetical protein